IAHRSKLVSGLAESNSMTFHPDDSSFRSMKCFRVTYSEFAGEDLTIWSGSTWRGLRRQMIAGMEFICSQAFSLRLEKTNGGTEYGLGSRRQLLAVAALTILGACCGDE